MKSPIIHLGIACCLVLLGYAIGTNNSTAYSSTKIIPAVEHQTSSKLDHRLSDQNHTPVKSKEPQLVGSSDGMDKITRLLYWRNRAETDWKTCLADLEFSANGPNPADYQKMEAFVIGLKVEDYPRVIELANEKLTERAKNFLIAYIFDASGKASPQSLANLIATIPAQISIFESAGNVAAVFDNEVGLDLIKSHITDITPLNQKTFYAHILKRLVLNSNQPTSFAAKQLELAVDMLDIGDKTNFAMEAVSDRAVHSPKSTCEILSGTKNKHLAACGSIVMKNWAKEEPKAAGNFLASLPNDGSINRDYLIAGYVPVAAFLETKEISELWLNQIRDKSIVDAARSSMGSALNGEL